MKRGITVQVMIAEAGRLRCIIARLDRLGGRAVLAATPAQALEGEDDWIEADWDGAGLQGRGVDRTTVVVPLGELVTKALRVPCVKGPGAAVALARELAEALPMPLETMAWEAIRLHDDGVEGTWSALALREERAMAVRGRLRFHGIRSARLTGSPLAWLQLEREAGLAAAGASLFVGVEHAGATLVFQDRGKRELQVTRRLGSAGGGERSGPELERELVRAIAAYRRQEPAWQPTRILLAGEEAAALAAAMGPVVGVGVEACGNDGPGVGWPVEGLEAVPPAHRALVAGVLLDEDARASRPFDLRGAAERAAAARGRPHPWLWGTALLWVLAGAIGALPAWHTRQLLAGQARWIEHEAAPWRARAAELDEIEAAIAIEREAIAGMAGLAQSRGDWIHFLIDLQDRLGAVENVWIDALEFVPLASAGPSRSRRRDAVAPAGAAAAGVTAMEEPGRRLQLRGRLVDPDHPLERVSSETQARVAELIDGFADSAFILEVTDRRFESLESGLLQFTFTLTLNPERVL